MPKPFNGVVNLDIRDSTPDWDAFLPDRAPDGAPNVLVVLYDDTGLRGLVAVRRPDRHADDGSPRRERADLLAVAHHGAVLADAVVVPHRPQPPPERLRVDLRDVRPGSPATTRTSRRENATMATVLRDAGWSTFWVGKNHNVADRRVDDGRVEEGLAARPGLRPLLRLHRRRDEQLVSRPRRGQPLRRSAVRPEDGYHLSKDLADKALELHPRRQAVRAREALVPVVLPGREPRARTTRRRSTSTSTRASSTTATRRTANGSCRA